MLGKVMESTGEGSCSMRIITEIATAVDDQADRPGFIGCSTIGALEDAAFCWLRPVKRGFDSLNSGTM